MRAVIYARESSDDTGKAPPITEQIERGKEYIKEKGYELMRIYIDNGFSGGNWNRPDWRQLIKDAKFHKFGLVIVWNQDRIARDTEQFLWFYRNLKGAYVQVFSITEGMINMETAGDRIKHTSLAMVSEAFRLITSDKVKKTYLMKKKVAESNGDCFRWGRPKKIIDYNEVWRLRAEGLSLRKIAESCGCSYQTINRILQMERKLKSF